MSRSSKSPWWVKVRGAPRMAWQPYRSKKEPGGGEYSSAAQIWKEEGYEVVCASWYGAVIVKFYKVAGEVWVDVKLVPWPMPNGKGRYKTLYSGPADRDPEPVPEQMDLLDD